MEKWEYDTGEVGHPSPVIGADGTVYVAVFPIKLSALNPNGNEKWQFDIETGNGHPGISCPSIDAEGDIYFGTWNNSVFAVKSGGTLKWQSSLGGAIFENAPVIGSDGAIYVGATDKFYALNADGSNKWTFETGAAVTTTAAIGSNGSIFFGTNDRKFYALNPDGTQKWVFQANGPIESSPVIGPDGTIYFGSWDNNLYAIHSSEKLADSPWPMMGHDVQHTGRFDGGVEPILPDNKIPKLTAIGDQVIKRGMTKKVSLTALDADRDTIQFRITLNPGFLYLDNISQRGSRATATLTIDASSIAHGTYSATVQVSDGQGGMSSESFDIVVEMGEGEPDQITGKWYSEEFSDPETGIDLVLFLDNKSDGSATVGIMNGPLEVPLLDFNYRVKDNYYVFIAVEKDPSEMNALQIWMSREMGHFVTADSIYFLDNKLYFVEGPDVYVFGRNIPDIKGGTIQGSLAVTGKFGLGSAMVAMTDRITETIGFTFLSQPGPYYVQGLDDGEYYGMAIYIPQERAYDWEYHINDLPRETYSTSVFISGSNTVTNVNFMIDLEGRFIGKMDLIDEEKEMTDKIIKAVSDALKGKSLK